MRLSNAWIIASKDFKIFIKKKSILYSIIGSELYVSIGLPFIIKFVEGKLAGLAMLPVLIDSYSFWFVSGI